MKRAISVVLALTQAIGGVMAQGVPTQRVSVQGQTVQGQQASILPEPAMTLNLNHVRSQMCIFPSGGHGYGFTTPALGDDALGAHRELFFENVAHFLDLVR